MSMTSQRQKQLQLTNVGLDIEVLSRLTGKRALMWGGLIVCLVASFQSVIVESIRMTGTFSEVYRSFHQQTVESIETNPTRTLQKPSVPSGDFLFNSTFDSLVVFHPRIFIFNKEPLDGAASLGRSMVVAIPIEKIPRDEVQGFDDSATAPLSTSGKTYREFEMEWFEECTTVLKQQNAKTELIENNLQFQIRPSCNTFHELRITNGDHHNGTDYIELLSMEGSWRSVWLIKPNFQSQGVGTLESENVSTPNGRSSFVMKILHFHREYDDESFSMHQMDAFVMETLAASDYVVNSYGFCGQSVFTDMASTSGRSLLKKPNLKWLTRLKLARDLARGLADLHALTSLWRDSYEDPSNQAFQRISPPLRFAHHDVNIANTLGRSDGQIQWNDFNLGVIPRYRKDENNGKQLRCPLPIRFDGPLWRSPEEILNKTGYLDGSDNAMQAADVFSLGNVLFQVLSKHQPWSHLEGERPHNVNQTSNKGKFNETTISKVKLATGENFTENQKKASLLSIAHAKVQDQLPYMPERYKSRPEAKLLWKQIERCYQWQPTSRPSAWKLAVALGRAYEKFYKNP